MGKDDKQGYSFFDRDVSWLSFNKRVLMEALDEQVPLYERLNFLSIFSSNLEEFYQVRVASLRAEILKMTQPELAEKRNNKLRTLGEITSEVKEQEALFKHAWEDVMVKDLSQAGVDIITHYHHFKGKTKSFVEQYFREEIFPFLQPVMVNTGLIKTFIRDKRIYLCVAVKRKEDRDLRYYMIKLPFTKAPRFLTLPSNRGRYSYTFLDEVVRLGLESVFVGYEVLGAYSFKISRDADVLFDETEGGVQLAESIESIIRMRKIGSVTRFQYDDAMPADMLQALQEAFEIPEADLLPSRRHLQLQDLRHLPNPLGSEYEQQYPQPIPHTRWDKVESKIAHLLTQDEALLVPYSSFNYLLDTLHEASNDPRVKGIKLTQYRVADDSEVIDVLIKAASRGKEVTVFVELKARFDEENNLQTAQRMMRHGIKIIYSIPKLKVHAKTCFIEFYPNAITHKVGIAIFSTGNFNEKTARIYSDVTLFTSRTELASELQSLFLHLEQQKKKMKFEHLLVARNGMVEEIHALIDYEIAEQKAGRKGRIVLKMNSLEEEGVIKKLYEASEAGVEIDLLVRGICRLVPNQPYSKNIRVTRLVDIYLEHARIWYFYHGGEERMYIASADWMRRNLYRRIECATPIREPQIKEFLKEVLRTGMTDNVNAVLLNEALENIPKKSADEERSIRVQMELYEVTEKFVNLPASHFQHS